MQFPDKMIKFNFGREKWIKFKFWTRIHCKINSGQDKAKIITSNQDCMIRIKLRPEKIGSNFKFFYHMDVLK